MRFSPPYRALGPLVLDVLPASKARHRLGARARSELEKMAALGVSRTKCPPPRRQVANPPEEAPPAPWARTRAPSQTAPQSSPGWHPHRRRNPFQESRNDLSAKRLEAPRKFRSHPMLPP